MVEDLTFCFLALQIILSLCVLSSFQGFTLKSVLITMRIHLFPFRTQKLSSFVPKILGGQPPGKIGRCRHSAVPFRAALLSYSSLAQLAEHAAVNRRVVGSSPTGGAKKRSTTSVVLLFLALSFGSRQRRCELMAARLLTGPRPCAAGGRYSKDAGRKKQGAVRSAASEQCDYVFDRAGQKSRSHVL